MTEKKHVITRRDFIRSGSSAVLGSLLGLPLVTRATGQTTRKSRVVLIRNQRATEGYGSLDHGTVVQMLDDAVTVTLGTKDPAAAWRKIANPDDIVGIKSNVWNRLPTPPELERAITSRTKLVLPVHLYGQCADMQPLLKLAAELNAVVVEDAAQAIGDDRLQKQSRGYVVPDSFTHGSSAQRVRWFHKGLEIGDINQCDTFSTDRF